MSQFIRNIYWDIYDHEVQFSGGFCWEKKIDTNKYVLYNSVYKRWENSGN